MIRHLLKYFTAFLLSLFCLQTAAQDTQTLLCNLQGREIALRINEEVDTSLSADGRIQIADIAEQVCRDYAGQFSGNIVTQRPGQGREAVLSPNASVDESVNESINENIDAESDKDGLFSDIKIIDPADRVRRPGLKRP